MLTKKIIPIILLLSSIWYITLPGDITPAFSQNLAANSSSPLGSESVPVLSCDGLGDGGDHVDTVGIRFMVDQSFSAVVVRVAGTSSSQTVSLNAELRSSTGFTTNQLIVPKITKTFIITSLFNSTPYQEIRFDFSPILVNTSQTFTLKIYPSDSSQVFIEVNQPLITCPNALITANNTESNPAAIGSPAGFKVLGPDPLTYLVNSTYSSTPPRIDGQLDLNEWAGATPILFDNGSIGFANDQSRLYVYIDVTGETVDNPDDTLLASVDINKDQNISAGIDKLYQVDKVSGNLRYAYYTGPVPPNTGFNPLSYSARAKGFGCFATDKTLSLITISSLKHTCLTHRVWELAFDLNEIKASTGQTVHIGIQVSSSSPAFTNTIPTNGLADFQNLIAVKLASAPMPAVSQDAGSSVGLDANPMEVTQAIQDLTKNVHLVAGKNTVVRVYAHTSGTTKPEPAQVYLFGSSAGVDLPGSPLSSITVVSPVSNRNLLKGTTNFILPDSWIKSASITLTAAVIDPLNNQQTSSPLAISFSTVKDPTDWMIPVNTGTAASPSVVTDDEIGSQQSFWRGITPTQDIQIIRQPSTSLGPQTNSTVMSALNHLYDAAAIAYALSFQATGTAPFVFPDQIFGMTPTGVGQSNPVWAGGSGRIASGFKGSSREASLAHAINHNLDRSTQGTWGRNVPNGCGTQNADKNWPNPTSAINTVGFDLRTLTNATGNPGTILSSIVPDLMSHCQSGTSPTQWISPYRWENWFNYYANLQAYNPSGVITPVYYLSGSINRASGSISGSLDPIIIQPGAATDNPGTGNYSIQFISGSTTYQLLTFPIQFMDDPEESIDKVYFNFQIPVSTGPDPSTVTKIILKNQSTSLMEVPVNQNSIGLNIVSPAAGASWSGVQTITWNSTNTLGRVLQYTLLFSPDGTSWFPVASGINATNWSVDTSALPGSKGQMAKFKLIASDGFITNQVDSGLFTLAIKPPQISIRTPQNGQFISPISLIELVGDAYDVQDGYLPADALVWMEDNNLLGVGQKLAINLPPGSHTLSLFANNSQGKTQSSSVTINVSNPTYLPMAFK